MSAAAIVLLLATAEPTDAVLASGEMLPVASEKLSNCIVYNAVRSDDGMSDVADLVATARIKCAVTLGIWRFFTKRFVSARSPNADAETIILGSEKAFFETIRTRVSTLVEDGRKN